VGSDYQFSLWKEGINMCINQNAILLVEDNPDDEALTIRALKKNFIANPVVVVRDGAEALDYLFAEGQYHDRNPNQLPVLILLDLKLPKVDGLEVLRRLRAESLTQLIPVVVLTTSNEERDMLESYSLGANSYVLKPVDFDQFITAVGSVRNVLAAA
jgi:two-component system response regulator